ncbi:MAG: 2Fe-2S iron-sulfur cluster-binding protein [Desulfobacterales bacterium]|nr:2Fe-2S iron-sulfur cluster-binding protein [Desulfobacterales bacterium]
MITLQIDDKKVEVAPGTNLLEACLDKGIYIPNLCHLDGMEHPPASCRLCFVEIEGTDHPVIACKISVDREMAVQTGTPRIRRLQKTALRLLLSVHDVDCKNCPANRKCALQDIARFLSTALKSGHLDVFLKKVRIDRNHPRLDYYPNRCVLCGKCVYICQKQHQRRELTFAKRGFETVIGFFDIQDGTPAVCRTCHACAEVCPVAALIPKTEYPAP